MGILIFWNSGYTRPGWDAFGPALSLAEQVELHQLWQWALGAFRHPQCHPQNSRFSRNTVHHLTTIL